MVGVVTKSRVGFSVAVVTVITTVGSATLWHLNASSRYVTTACSVFGFVGLLSLIRGRFRAAETAEWTHKGKESQPQENAAQEEDDNPLEFLKRYTYWGMMLLLSASLLYVSCTLFHPKAKSLSPKARHVVARKVVKKPPVAVAKPTVAAKPAVVFPSLTLQGIDFNGHKSLALIDGVTVAVGESIGEAKLVEVGRDYVKVAMNDETRVLRLGD
jgi:hypothetical protein